MRGETWELLNGQGFGETAQGAEMQNAECRVQNCGGDASASLSCDPDMGLRVPAFMFETTQSVLVPASAYYAQGKGRVKKQVRAEKKQRRDFKNGIAYVVMIFGALVLANVLMEVICR